MPLNAAQSRESAGPAESYRSTWYRLIILAWALLLVFLWLVPREGPSHPFYGLIFVSWTFFLGPALGGVALRLPSRWFQVPKGERKFHRMLGVGVFAWFLDRSGYSRRFVRPLWESMGYRAGSRADALRFRAQAAQAGAGAHGLCFVIHVLLGALALFTGYLGGALMILLPGVLVHLYPVLLQRSIILRLRPLLVKLGRRPSQSTSPNTP